MASYTCNRSAFTALANRLGVALANRAVTVTLIDGTILTGTITASGRGSLHLNATTRYKHSRWLMLHNRGQSTALLRSVAFA